jgi:uncharacterized protein YqjF (DUF2071 family)
MVPLAFGWRHVLFANWRVDPDALAAHLPDAFAVNEHDGSGWLTVVPFANVHTRPRGLPAWLGVRLPELNLRTYVTCDGEPGVYFLSLDAASLLAVLGARVTHHLPYYYARVRLQWDGDRVAFESRRRQPGDRPARYAATYRPVGERFEADPGSLAAFLTERRRLYTQAPDGTVRHTDVTHPPWPLYRAEAAVAENTLFEANGFDHPGGDPVLYYSPGVDVVTARSRRWRPATHPRQASNLHQA